MDVGGKKKQPPHPRAKANIFSALTFSWLIPIFYQGFKKEMDTEDLFEPLAEHASKNLGDQFENEWEKELKSARANGKQPKLLNVIKRVFLLTNCMYSLALAILELGVRVLQPFLIGILVRYFSVVNSSLPEPSVENATYAYRLMEIFETPTTQISHNEAIFYAAAIVADIWVGIAIIHPYMMGVMHQGMQCRVGACSLIYRKALRLSKTALGETTVGQVVNLLSNDVNRFDIAVIFLHYLWMAPVEAAIVCYFVYRVVDWSTFLGLLFLIVQIPLQVSLGKKSSFYRLRTAIRTDERVRLMSEIIGGIQVIKMYAWEMPFAQLVETARKREMHEVRGSYNIRGLLFSFYIFSSRFSIFLTLVGYVLSGGQISPENIFILTAFYNLLRNSMTIFFPNAITQVAEALISVGRLEKFLMYDENTPNAIMPSLKELSINGIDAKPPPIEVRFEKASFKWLQETSEPNLSNLTLSVPSGSLLAVIGPVGAGKSTLIQAVLKEVRISSGSLTVNGRISYASQEPWLFVGSIRQNITFGLPYNRTRYKRVVDVCALNRDFELFPFGDKTIVGERGTSLSGGQRARINLARAVYKEADIYLLDDPLSAVDTHVGKHLFEDCISSFLRNKTVILVTHQLQYLTHCDHILILHNGKTEAEGSFNQLQASGMNFAKLLHHKVEDEDKSDKRSVHSRKDSISSSISRVTEDDGEDPKIIEEKIAVGGLGWKTYFKFFEACHNWAYVFAVVFLMFATQVISSLNDWWASKWSAEEEYNQKTNQSAEIRHELTYMNVYIYSGLNVATVVITLSRSLLFFAMCRVISQNLHDDMFNRITGAPMKFFFDNPSGRILNRFAKDIGAIDELLPQTMIDFFQIFLSMIAVVVICAVISPVLLIPTFFIIVIFYFLRIVYVRTSRNIKRLEGATRSPVFSHLNASIQGLTTIRAFAAQDILRQEFDSHQDLHSATWYIFIASSRAFGFWLDMVCGIYIAVVCVVLLYFGGNAHILQHVKYDSGSDAGLAVTQSVGLMGMLQWGMRQSAEVENLMTSVERVLEYSLCEQEAPKRSKPENKPPPSWPTKGAVTFENLELRYDPLSEPVLNGISLIIQPQEKIGIVGRTGAGKSTLIAALFRLAYIEGKISIDSVDTSLLGLHDLRSKISIIPQEPVLFSGTLRKNLDPFDEYPDWCLWNALEEVELKEVVSESSEGLHGKMSEGGSNFSVGQRQLICLARAIVRNNRLLIMDEATANVDPQTDMLIQRTIRRKFNDCTVLTIAHRLNTVMDSDRILVMDSGSVAEFDHPYILLKDDTSMLSGLVEQTGKSSARKLMSVAKKNYKLKLRREEALRMLQAAHEDAQSADSDSSRSSSPELPHTHVLSL